MIVTKYFVYIHTSRTGGTFLNKLILNHVPGAKMIQYHGHLKDLPEQYSHLPVIGFVRNPWDWYVSMFYDYQRKQQYVFRLISENKTLDFEKTITKFLTLGDNNADSNQLLKQLVATAPKAINEQTPPRRARPGLLSKYFERFPENTGYYSWLFNLMYVSNQIHDIHIGRFEYLRTDILRLFELTGTPVTQAISDYLNKADALNPSRRPHSYSNAYSSELIQLVANKDKLLIDRFDYDFYSDDKFSMYPKTDFFNHLGSIDVSDLISRVLAISENLWEKHNEEKPNQFNELNNTQHINFRYLHNLGSPFDSYDQPIWDDWKGLLLPIMEQAAKKLGYTNFHFPRVMLAKLPSGGKISPHVDLHASYYVHKIHVPLITNSQTLFHVGKQAKNLQVGEIVEVNNQRGHAVDNDGVHDRIHLVFECYNMDDYGKPS